MRHLPLLLILVAAAALRFHGLNWDDGQHLHPDERFIAIVEDKIRLPGSIGAYFDTGHSPLNPYNNGFDGFAYGTLPLFLGRVLGELAGFTGYDRIVLLGRVLSALADLGTVVFVYALADLLYGRRAAIVAGAVAAFSVLDIQLAHFFTVDTFATFFVAWSLYYAYRVWTTGGQVNQALLGIGVGFAAASKISAITLAPILVLACVLPWAGRRAGLAVALRALAISGIGALVAYRLTEPYAFLGNTPLDLRPNPKFLADMAYWVKISSGELEVPFMLQWTGTPRYLFALDNIVRWGLGPAAGLAALAGLLLAGFLSLASLMRARFRVAAADWHARHLLVVLWALLNLLYFGGQFAKFMRYLLPAYPALAVLAGFFVRQCWDVVAIRLESTRTTARLARLAGISVAAVVLVPTVLWALAFSHIYSEPHSRITASRWLIDNAPSGARLAVEHWDDALPLSLPGKDRRGFVELSMTLYDDDNPDKLRKLLDNLNRADLLILSSNRLYGSIPRLPQRYPLATEYYRALFDGRLGYEQVAEFTSRPRILDFEIDDDNAQEDFTVYDHPKVQIFRRGPDYDPARVAALLGAIPLDTFQRGRAAPAATSRAPILTPSEFATARAGGTWSSLFQSTDLANRLALPVWWLAAALLGLAAWPLLWMLTPHLADRGFGLARIFGLLVTAYAAWLLASLKLEPFGRATLIGAALALAVLSIVVAASRWHELSIFIRSSWPALLAGEAAFALGFTVCLGMRLVNPDLWHSVYGGEKPMDFAYLNAVIKSDYFPPYDPWFAGGSINYYYFGFVLVAALVKLTGIVPSTAYNLALALWFGLTCQATFSVAYSLARPRGDGVARSKLALATGGLAVLFLAFIGNLDAAVQLRDSLWQAGGTTFQSGLPLVGGLFRVVAGLFASLRGARGTEFDFWRSTRLIGPEDPGPIHEFPFFSFLYADLHAHVLALPLTLLSMGLAIELSRSRRMRGILSGRRGLRWLNASELLRFAALLTSMALTIGALRAANTWDFPTYLAVALVALATLFRPIQARGVIPGLAAALIACGAVYVGSALFFAPYIERYQLFYSGIEAVKAQTQPSQFFTIHGLWLFVIASYLVLEIVRRTGRGLWSPATAVRSIGSYYSAIMPMPFDWALESAWRAAALAVLLGALGLAAVGFGSLGITMAFGCALAAFTWLRWRSPEAVLQCGLALVALGALSLPELVAVQGDVGRMNTVFKFYYQAWALMSLLSAVWLVRLLARKPRVWQGMPGARRLWRVLLALLLAAVVLYPIRAAPTKLSARFGPLPLTLDGMAFMQRAAYKDRDRDVGLPDDYEALRWMERNIGGSPVVLEANTGLYKWGSRVAIFTGLPTVIGWDWHQKQQRVGMSSAVEDRLKDVRTMYESPRVDQMLPLARRYSVEYIYVGGLEKIYYPQAGLKKFEEAPADLLERVYEKGSVTIYRLLGGS